MYTNVSSEFLEVLARPSRHFAARFKDNGTVIDLNIKNMKVTTGTCGGSKLAVGCAYAAYIDVTAVYTDLLLEGKELFLELGLLLDDDSYEWIPFGYWTVQKPKKSMDTMTFQAVDRMAGKLFEDYETALTYPATIQAVLAEFATNTGLTVHCNLQTTQQITVPIEGVTQRGALAVIAATLLGNAWIDRNGDVQITSIGGGTSVPINYDYVKGQPEMDEESTVIEGVKVYTVAGQTDTWMERGSGNMVEVSDVYMTDTILDAVKANIIGLTYGGGEVSFMGNPLLDPSDIIYFRGGSDMVEYMLVTHLDEEIAAEDDANITGLDYKSYNVPCLEIVQEFDGGLLTTVSAPGQFETTEQTYTVGAVTEELRRQAKEIATTQAEVQTAQQTADNAMTTANGKNKIFYQAATPVSGMSEGDLWFDTDGGNAIYEYKKSGNTYSWTLRQLGQGSIAAGSITANEINVNNLSAISGILGSVTVGGANNADGVITIKDSSNQTIGYWDNTGILASKGIIGPWTIGSTGIYSGKSSFDDTTYGVFVGTTGISLGGGTTGVTVKISPSFIDAQRTNNDGVIYATNTTSGQGRASMSPLGFNVNSINQSSGQVASLDRYYQGDYGQLTLLEYTANSLDPVRGIWLTAGTPSATFKVASDVAILKTNYGSTNYNLIRNHNNGNISISASSGSLYLGYENTSTVDILGTAVVGSGYINVTKANASAWVQARNADGGNSIYIQAETAGTVTLGSRAANGTAYTLLQRANNSSMITAYNYWQFDTWLFALTGIVMRNNGLTKGTTPSGDTNKAIVFTDKDGYASQQNDAIGAILGGVASNNSSYMILRTFKNDTSANTYAQMALYYPSSGSPYIETSSGCSLNVNANIASTVSSGEAQVMARNGLSANRIILWSNSSSGQCGLYSYGANNTAYDILRRANNAHTITAYGDWTFNNVVTVKGYSGYSGALVPSTTTDGNRVAQIEALSSTVFHIYGQWGTSGTTYAWRNAAVSSSDIRLKENIKDCTISALPVINSIRMREFDWKDGRHQNIGVIADELEKIDSRLSIGGGYDENGSMDVKSVDTFYLVGYLVKAVQELSAEVNRLKGVA